VGRNATADTFFGIACEQEGGGYDLLRLFHELGWTDDPYEARYSDEAEMERVAGEHLDGLELDYSGSTECPYYHLAVSGTRSSFRWGSPQEVGPDLFEHDIPPALLQLLQQWAERLDGFTAPGWYLDCSYT